MNRAICAALAVGLSFAGLASAADAALTTTATGTYVAFPIVNYLGSGPQTFDGITWSSTNATTQGGSVFGYNGGYGFSSNGYSTDTLVGLNDSSDVYGVVDTMRFDFSTPVSSIGATLNWVPSQAPVTISIYDAANTLLESYTLSQNGDNIATPNSFYGFQQATANIASFRLTDGYVAAIGGLYGQGLQAAAVPEAGTWAMMIAGIGLVGGMMRLSRRADERFTRRLRGKASA